MFIEPTILSLFTVILRKRSLKRLIDVNIRGWYILFISASIQAFISVGKRVNKLEIFINKYFLALILISYLLMILIVVLNIKSNYMKLFLIGIILNLIVISGNGGKMPVSLNGIGGIREESTLPQREFDIKHIGINENTKFKYLADIILIPRPYPLPKILSLGDIFLMIGIFMFFQEETKSQVP